MSEAYKKYSWYDYQGDNWDDSSVIDRLPVSEVIAEYRRAKRDDELIYGWCVWRREFEKYQRIKKMMGPEWTAEHKEQITWNLEYDIMKDCQENDLMEVWLRRQKLEKPYRSDFEDIEEDIEAIYNSLGGSIEKEINYFRPIPEEEWERQQKEKERQKKRFSHKHKGR